MNEELLKKIEDYKALKQLNEEELKKLSNEIRELIINTVSKTGGHLSSNLGTIELTIAALICFDPLKDDIIFDVGHQSYTYKILTGRKDKFYSLRQENGISGYPDPRESIFDKFISGHSSTSLAVAAGFSVAKKLMKDNSYTISIVGDGALTAGEAFEALNNIGHENLNIIVILNDNEMSISKNVGSLSKHLSQVRSSPLYMSLSERYKSSLKKYNTLGKITLLITEKFKAAIKQMVFPEMIFEELGFVYLGPVNGHDISEVCTILERAKKYKKPVIIHALTKKGKGFADVENNPIKFHSSPPFIIENNKCKTIKQNEKSFSEVFGETLKREGEKDKKIVAITAAMCEGLYMSEFASSFPDRFFDVGIAEQYAVTFGASLAHKGLKPIVGIYSTFLQRAYDQVIHDCCILKEPVIFIVDRAGAVSDDGPTHQGSFDISFLNPIPNNIIMSPSSASELEKMFKWSLNNAKCPIFIRFPKDIASTHSYSEPIELGKSVVIKRGKDCTIIALGNLINIALEASKILEENGLTVTLIDARFAKPFDSETIREEALKTRFLVTLEDGVLEGGFGEKIIAFLNNEELKNVKVLTFGLKEGFSPPLKRKKILEYSGLTKENIANTIISEKSKIR
ncbi:MAG TPA: 1-deoxy-D-xylulose-5-phosphate synthase [Caldisericia bacterium]|nr:1-deoxy-D-xylulose-5-phosphate synthase [Caldisericia bacterium]